MKYIVLMVVTVAVAALVSACGVFSQKDKGVTILTFLGAPGSGKGTIAEQCVKDLGFATVSTGNLLREAVARGDELGKQVEGLMKEGKLVPDELITSIVESWLTRNLKDIKTLVLDGYPRTEKQAQQFLDLLKTKFPQVSLRVVEIVISDAAIINRLSDRLVCESCHAVFSRKMLNETEKCLKCGGKLIQREDDKPEVVKERLNVYAQHAQPLLNFYKAAGVRFDQLTVEGKTVKDVFAEFKKIL
jgi:adenylate kinase